MLNIGHGIVYPKPIGGIVSSNPNMTDAQIEAQRQMREQEKQRQIQNIVDKFANKNNPKN